MSSFTFTFSETKKTEETGETGETRILVAKPTEGTFGYFWLPLALLK